MEKEQAANTDVDNEEDIIPSEDVSDSPSDEENGSVEKADDESVVDDSVLEGMSEEELRAELVKEREAKKRAIESVRNQAKKHREQLLESADDDDTQDEVVEEDDEGKDAVDLLEEVRKLREEVKAFTNPSDIQEYTKGFTTWLYDQSWGEVFTPEAEGSDVLYADLASEIKRRLDYLADKGKPVSSKEEYQDVARKAAAVILDDPTPLVSKESQPESGKVLDEYQKTQASGMSGVAGQGPREKILTRSQIDMAIACGHDPKEVYG